MPQQNTFEKISKRAPPENPQNLEKTSILIRTKKQEVENMFWYQITDADVADEFPALASKPQSQDDMQDIYEVLVDHREYPDVNCWIADMIKSGIIAEIWKGDYNL